MAEKGIKNKSQNRRSKWRRKGEIEGQCTWGISEMEAIGGTWEKSSAVEGDALKSGDSGTDEFLSREKGDLGARSCGERRGKVR